MKSINFKMLFALSISFLLFNCSSSEGDGGTTPDPDGGSSASSITLTSNSLSQEVGQVFTFTVKTNTNHTVTSSSTITVDGTPITGNTYTPTASGTFNVKATYNTLVSQISITATPPPATVVSIVVSANAPTSNVGDASTFTVEATMSDGSTQDQTSESTYNVDGNDISSNRFLNTATGQIMAYAKLGSLTSNTVSVQVNDMTTAPSSYTKKAIIEDYTGTWCGWCPRVAYAAEQVEAQSDKVFVVAVHNGDNMANSFGSTLETEFSIQGFPTAWVNRKAVWAYPEPNNISQALNEAQGNISQGLAVNSSLSGNEMSIVVSTGFAQANAGTKLVVYILEDGITQNQANYTSYYAGADPIVNFTHNHILRHSLTNVMGDAISTGAGVAHKVYNLTVPTAIADANNTAILAFLTDSTGRNVINAQYSKINVDKDFD